MDDVECRLLLTRVLRGIDDTTADEIRALPPKEKEYVLLKYEAAWAQIMANIENSVTLSGSGYRERIEKMNKDELVTEVLNHKKGLDILLLNITQGLDVAMPHDASKEAKNLLAVLVGSIPLNVRYKNALVEIENLSKTYDAKVKVIGEKAETQITAEKQKYDADKAAIDSC